MGGIQFDRTRSGSLYDRGASDSYYRRSKQPHWYSGGTAHGERITYLTEAEIKEYNLGYDNNDYFKDWDD